MRSLSIWRALWGVDVRSVSRDSMLRWIVFLAPGIALLYRFLIPAATDWARSAFDFDLTPYHPLLMSLVAIIFPGFIGTVIGFLLLDQRDDRTLPALLVTPMRLRDYLGYRLGMPTGVGMIFTALMFPLAGFLEVTLLQVVVVSIAAAPLSTLYALFLGAFAQNKVQGFALAKGAGVFMIPAFAAYFVAWPWEGLCVWAPQYWALKVFWLFHEGAPGEAIGMAAIGVAYQGGLVWLLGRRFAAMAGR